MKLKKKIFVRKQVKGLLKYIKKNIFLNIFYCYFLIKKNNNTTIYKCQIAQVIIQHY